MIDKKVLVVVVIILLLMTGFLLWLFSPLPAPLSVKGGSSAYDCIGQPAPFNWNVPIIILGVIGTLLALSQLLSKATSFQKSRTSHARSANQKAPFRLPRGGAQ